ncbi:MMPL family transporter [Lachnospiraceae bacterium ZAX-1]
MEKQIKKVLRHRVAVVIAFVAAAILSLILASGVGVNFNMADYLPEKAASTIALETMNASYEKAVPNLRVMIRDVRITEAIEYKKMLENVNGVSDINWLDDQVNLKIPLEMQDDQTVADWFVDGNALYSIVLEEELQKEALQEIKEIIGEHGAMSGNPVDTVNARTGTSSEIGRMMLIIIPLLIVILLFTTTSWIEPLFFMFNVGIAIALNMGTNIFFGEISFVTRTTSTILQLACSMDYAIFLLDRFAEFRKEGLEPLDAITSAIAKSAVSILSSGMTTVVGFAALIIMQFRIGADMGIVLSKGIFFSLLSTLLFMPCLAMFGYKLIDKTTHRPFMPSFKHFAVGVDKAKGMVAGMVLILLIPCYLAGQQISFDYGMSKMSGPDSQIAKDRTAINEIFGESASFALLVPNSSTKSGGLAKETALCRDIEHMPEVAALMSYVELIGNTIPQEFVPDDKLRMLNSDTYTRMVITARVPPESDMTFAFVEKLRGIAKNYYPGSYHLAGEVVNVYDMKDTITSDRVKVNLISIGGIALILLLTFKSFSLPIILLLTIEASVFINVSVPYFTGQSINYIGYLIISSVQLGATVDYAILFANRYIENRESLSKKQAIRQTIADTAGSIFTSGGILTMAGLVLGFISSNTLISQLGILIARGAVLSMTFVLAFLPALLACFEKIIMKTTKGLHFREKERGV